MTLVFSDAVFISSQTPDPLTLPWGCKSLLGEAKTKKAQSRTVISEVLRKPSLGVSRRCSRRGPAHLITAGQMKESNLLEKRSLKGGSDARAPGPDPTESNPSSEPQEPGLGARSLRAEGAR